MTAVYAIFEWPMNCLGLEIGRIPEIKSENFRATTVRNRTVTKPPGVPVIRGGDMLKKMQSNRRLAFTPSAPSAAYFRELVERMTRDRGLGVRVTQREAFSYMVELARIGEQAAAPSALVVIEGTRKIT